MDHHLIERIVVIFGILAVLATLFFNKRERSVSFRLIRRKEKEVRRVWKLIRHCERNGNIALGLALCSELKQMLPKDATVDERPFKALELMAKIQATKNKKDGTIALDLCEELRAIRPNSKWLKKNCI